jgi:hypothetical protein
VDIKDELGDKLREKVSFNAIEYVDPEHPVDNLDNSRSISREKSEHVR